MSILVFGASGTIGSHLIQELSTAGESARAAFRSRPPAEQAGVQPVKVDLATGEGLDDALTGGVESIFLLVGGAPDQVAAELRALEAAQKHSVKRIVKLSVLGAETEAYSFAKIHRPIERAIESSGLGWTFLRPGSFMQNFITFYGDTIRSDNAIFLPCGDAREAHVDARDIARVAAHVLTSDGDEYNGQAYDLLGPESISYADAAAIISKEIGRTISYVDISEEDFKAAMLAAGLPEPMVEDLTDLFRFIREGSFAKSGTAVKDITGREPTNFSAFARAHAGAWKESER